MLGNILPPYHSLQELNLDWILTKIKNMLRFLPDDGAVGQVLRRTPHGAEWSDEQGAGGSVTSVNGMQGAVVLDAADVGALPDSTVIPDSTSDLINDAGFVDAAGAAAAAPVQSVNGQTGAVVISSGAVDSVNGQTGTVVLDAADVGALPDTYTAPVNSVNGQTGTVVLDAADVGALPDTYTAPVTSVNGQTGDVTVPTGISGWGTPASITFPYTPTQDGFIFGYIAPQNSATSYMFITEDGTAWARASSYAGSGYGMCFPARSGKEYAVALSANISSQTFRFIPFA